MPIKTEIQTTCPSCGRTFAARSYRSINVAESPELKPRVISGEIFVCECPSCGRRSLIKGDLLYHDPAQKLLVCLSDSPLSSDGMPGYTCRQVSDAGSLIEKVKIFDAGLDDVVMEMCKFVTLGELKKDVELKFLCIDGADQDITLTYPENGRMEMLSIGFNVYEDCAAIVRRNPVIAGGASGLCRIDQAWLGRYLG